MFLELFEPVHGHHSSVIVLGQLLLKIHNLERLGWRCHSFDAASALCEPVYVVRPKLLNGAKLPPVD
ncbi:MAG: hypothetical protein RM347_013070 [Nostoc sp. ChiQUE02]|uniref:hypothetical protein n=1 Tax=Nostoc sp. ChiQUE02 TaxID=3075377 RepID=UPI002AD3270F|nr:hypothetical protein [Nostoc sp. ChiQUE02]MDZ8233417.1 hypothetical protein [Nostoc sp. ChiQUE02]